MKNKDEQQAQTGVKTEEEKSKCNVELWGRPWNRKRAKVVKKTGPQ